MRNLFKQFRDLIPEAPVQAGTVTAVVGGVATVALPGGGTIQARGTASVGQKVFVRDNAIEGLAPALTDVLIEV